MLTVTPVPCYSDNYAYLLSRADCEEVVVVDGCESEPILAAIHGRRLTTILATHHHPDHIGGHEHLLANDPSLRIFGHAEEHAQLRRIPGQTHGLSDGDELQILGERVIALHVPGHTLTAVAYYFPDAGLLFTGDTLFGAGCGRLFEGTPPQMFASLQRLAALPQQTLVYSGHEYLTKNIAFARHIEPQNTAIADRQKRCLDTRARGEPCEPSTIGLERATNPFLRSAEPSVQAAVAGRPPELAVALSAVEVFARLRRWRSSF
ncbi:MAG: hydroxyacylglutathione hydrolase [Myxococcales bacterium]|nr:hydroxyacylglutathione hydrolase [Myxococcales bacterium]